MSADRRYTWSNDILMDDLGIKVCAVTLLDFTNPGKPWQLEWPDGLTELHTTAGDAHASIKQTLAGMPA